MRRTTIDQRTLADLTRSANIGVPRDLTVERQGGLRCTTWDLNGERKMPDFDRVIPILVYENIEAAHDFLVEAFGFATGGIHHDDEGTAVHAEVRAGDTAIWLHRVTPEHELASPGSSADASSGLVIWVEDVDAHSAHARQRGARLDSEPQDKPYGQREYGARDVEGHRWWFASPLA